MDNLGWERPGIEIQVRVESYVRVGEIVGFDSEQLGVEGWVEVSWVLIELCIQR